MTKIIEHYGLSPVKVYKTASKLYAGTPAVTEPIESDRIIGIEVEVENLQVRQNTSEVWVPTQDGSLRNNGQEFITRPIEAKWAPHALRELLQDVLSTDCCFSPRTSTHVHVNCQDLFSTQVIDIVLLYSILEPLFYNFAGRGRVKNIYCVPVADAGILTYGTNLKIDNLISGWSKYTGLNIVPIGDKGTIEFRHMHGTFDHEKLSVWIRLILKMIDYAVKQGTPAIRKLVLGFGPKTDLFGLLLNIFGQEDMQKFKEVSYSTIKPAVDSTKLAFMKPATQQTIMQERTLQSAYFGAK